MALDREAFMAASRGARRYHVIDLPGLGAARLQSLTQAEMRSLRRSLRDADGNANKERIDRLDGLLVAATVVDDSGARVFSDDDALGNGLDWMTAARGRCSAMPSGVTSAGWPKSAGSPSRTPQKTSRGLRAVADVSGGICAGSVGRGMARADTRTRTGILAGVGVDGRSRRAVRGDRRHDAQHDAHEIRGLSAVVPVAASGSLP